jgi:peptidylprolyl isomerase
MFKQWTKIIGSVIIMTASMAGAANAQNSTVAPALTPENTMTLTTTQGPVVIQLRPDLAPNHAARLTKLANEHFYDGVIFHRVIDGFMAQTGDPTGTGTGGSKEPDLKAEFTQYPYKRGTVGMARTSDPNSANSQFFICFTDDGCSFLTGQYTVVGQVVEGMENVDKLAKGEPPANPDKIVKATIGAVTTKSTTTTTTTAPGAVAPAAGTSTTTTSTTSTTTTK